MCDNKIKQLRLSRAWSQEQLAELASTSVRTIQRMESGQEPSLETLSALAAVFDVKISDLSNKTETKQATSVDERILNARIEVEQQAKFYKSLIYTIMLCIMFFMINYLATPNKMWAIYPTFFLVLSILIRWLRLFILKNKIQKWKQNKLQRLLKKE